MVSCDGMAIMTSSGKCMYMWAACGFNTWASCMVSWLLHVTVNCQPRTRREGIERQIPVDQSVVVE